MKKSFFISFLVAAVVSSCAGIKVLKEPPRQEKPQPGLTLGSFVNGGITVQKVGFWCEAKKGFFTFGAFGPTEDEARKNAQDTCHRAYKDSPCEISSCKHE